jgi:hypothetical protein
MQRAVSHCRIPAQPQRFRPLLVEPLESRLPLTAEIEPNNSTALATPAVAAADTLTGSLASMSDADFFSVNLQQGDSILIRSPTSQMPPQIQLLDSLGNIRMANWPGADLPFIAPQAGTYFVRLSPLQLLDAPLVSYSLLISTTPFLGRTEIEPNNDAASATSLVGVNNLRGNLASASDVDYYSFNASAGWALTYKWNQLPAYAPALRVYDSGNHLVHESTDGVGFTLQIPAAGSYRIAVSTDHTDGTFTGGYVGNFALRLPTAPGATLAFEVENPGTFEDAQAWDVSQSPSLVGSLNSTIDVDTFEVTVRTGEVIWFSSGVAVEIFDSLGRYRQGTSTGRAIGITSEHIWGASSKFYVVLRARGASDLGGYNMFAAKSADPRSAQRDMPLIFLDFTSQTEHFDFGPAPPLATQAAVPFLAGWVEGMYDQYDVEVTLVQPPAGAEYAAFGMGNLGFIGAAGYGFGELGSRRVTGDSVATTEDGIWNGFFEMAESAVTRVMGHELGHALTLTHDWHPMSTMGWAYADWIPQGQTLLHGPNLLTSGGTANFRNQIDIALQAGRWGAEVEPNNSIATAQDVVPWLSEMAADATPRNNRAVVCGSIGTGTDVDFYRFSAQAGQRFALDIDATEFQQAADLVLELLDSQGTRLAISDDALDRESGLESVDPYLVHQFATAGDYFVRVAAKRGGIGGYRLKVTEGEAFDTAGPRVIAALPEAEHEEWEFVSSTRQLIFWTNDMLDPATVTSANFQVMGEASGLRSGQVTFEPLDATLTWLADVPLPNDNYTVTILSGPTGVKDLRGNWLDGETVGALVWPKISGNGVAGGNFVTRFTVDYQDSVPAALSQVTYDRLAGANSGVFSIQFTDGLDIASAYAQPWKLLGAGRDGTLGTTDDIVLPLDVLINRFDGVDGRGSDFVRLFTRGIVDAGSYRIEGFVRDEVGFQMNVSANATVPIDPNVHGPSIIGLNFQPNSALPAPPAEIRMTFSGSVNSATLTQSNVRLRYSSDAVFYNADDRFIEEADGMIAWDPNRITASFQPKSPLPGGYYLLEVEGDTGGVADPAGRLLDGEFIDWAIQGNRHSTLWQQAPSGDGQPGGDYRAFFVIDPSLVPPTISNIGEQVVAEDGSIDIPFVIGDGDTPLANLTIQVSADLQDLLPPGALVLSGSGADRSLNITPLANRFGDANVTITVSDGAYQTHATFVVRVTPVNDPPSLAALSDPGAILEDAGVQSIELSGIAAGLGESQGIQVTATSSNPLLVPDPVVNYTSPSATGSLSYTPIANQSGTAVIMVTVRDDGGTANGGIDTFTRTFVVNITAVNDVPALGEVLDPAAILEDAGEQTVVLQGISAGPNETQPLTISATSSNPSLIPHPTVSFTSPSATGSLSYTPVANQSGTAVITLTVRDDGGTAHGGIDTFTRTFMVNVTAVNDVPTLGEVLDPAAILEDAGEQTVVLQGISAGLNETQTLTITATSSNPSLIPHPTVSYTSPSASGSLSYTPVTNQSGTAVITVTVRDGGGTTHGGADVITQTFTVNVAAVNDAPTLAELADPTAILVNAVQQNVLLSGLSAGPDEQQMLTIIATSSNPSLIPHPAVNYASPNATGLLSYIPAADQTGISTITVTVKDEGGTALGGIDSITRTFMVRVVTTLNPNKQPTLDVLESSVTILEDVATQTLSLSGITAGLGEAQVLTVTATSNNPGLITDPQATYTSPGMTGSLAYTPVLNHSGTAVISVTVKDDGGTAEGGVDAITHTFTVNVLPVNDAPTGTSDSLLSIAEDSGDRTIAIADLLGNDLKGPANEIGQSLALTSVSNSSGGTVQIFGINVIFSPTPDYHGPASFVYTLIDDGTTAGSPNPKTATATVSFTITEKNDPPGGGNDTLDDILEDAEEISIPFSALLSNDSRGPDNEAGQTLTIIAVEDPIGGSVAIDGTNIIFTPTPDFFGAAGFSYTLRDNGQTNGADDFLTNDAVVSFQITPVNDPPSFQIQGNGNQTATDENPLTKGPALEQIVPGWTLSIDLGPANESNTPQFVVENDNNGIFAEQPAVDADGTLRYKPKPNKHGTADVTVRLFDGQDNSDPVVFTIVITKPNKLHNSSESGRRTGLDVTGSTTSQPDGFIVAGDVLEVINYINARGSGPVTANASFGPPYPDTNGDNQVAADDVIAIINYINAGNSSEGEATGTSQPAASNSASDLFYLLAMDIAEHVVRRRRLL